MKNITKIIMDIKQKTIPELPYAFQNLFFFAIFFKKEIPFFVRNSNAGP